MTYGTPRPDSRERMVRAAERLFAERGINAVSMREVAAAAGQLNNSAVRYHFGSRDGLVDAIFRYRMSRIDERRRIEGGRDRVVGDSVPGRRIGKVTNTVSPPPKPPGGGKSSKG